MDAAAVAVEVARQRWQGPVGLFGTALGGVLAFYAAIAIGSGTGGDGLRAVACHNVLDLRNVQPVLRRARQRVLLRAATTVGCRLSPERRRLIDVPIGLIVARSDLADDLRLARALRRHPDAVRRYDLAGLISIFLTPEDKPDVAAQQVPTFVAVGSNDRVIPETLARAFTSRLSCPSQLWVLPGGSHQLLLEHPRALLPAVAGFFREHF
jgi:pimeloyl-ACP methyl ester carboxylesterase